MKNNLQLQQDVTAELACDPAVDASHIGVVVEQGVVTLTGHVCSFVDKWHAERAAQRVHGMKALEIELDVQLPALHQRDDQDIARSAKNVRQGIEAALARHASLNAKRIQVEVNGSNVILSGFADNWGEREAAMHAAWAVPGVQSVSDKTLITLS